MRCFYHGEVEAVAICKSCQRGLCHDCCAEVGPSSACRNRCEPEVEKLNSLLDRGQRAYQTNSALYRRSGALLTLMGVLFTGFGLYTSRYSEPNYFIIILGIAFF